MLRRIDRAVFDHDRYPRILDRLVGDARSLLDVGCGPISPARRAARRMERAVGIDGQAFPESGYTDMIQMDIRRAAEFFGPGSFDVVVCSDVIEHLTKDDGLALLRNMERIAARRVIVMTPNGFLPQNTPGQPLQTHRSGWRIWDFEDRGYTVRGIGGWKPLKGAHGIPRWWPRWFWGRLALLTETLVYRLPAWGFQLLVWKDVA